MIGVIAIRGRVAVVVRVAIRPQIDIALARFRRAIELLHVFRVRVAGDDRGDHERGVDDLAEAQLLGEIVRAAEQRRGRRTPFEQVIEPVEQHAVGEASA